MDIRTRLLDTSLDLFARHGYESVGVQQIVETAGVTKPTLYHYFGSKAGLLETLFDERAAELDRTLASKSTYQGNLTQSLRSIVDIYARHAQAQPMLYRFELGLYFAARESDGHRIAAGCYARRQAVVEAVFSAAVKDHGNLRRHTGTLAFSLIGMINSYIALELDGHLVFDARMRGEMVQRFSHGIYS